MNPHTIRSLGNADHPNNLGSVVALANDSGAIVNQYHYDPYGNIASETQQVTNPFRWIGAVWDSQARLYHVGARWYDPQICRWTQMDPLSPVAQAKIVSDPQNLNAYVYAQYNPTSYLDTNGYGWCKWLFFSLGAAAFIAVMLGPGLMPPSSGFCSRKYWRGISANSGTQWRPF